MLKRELAKLHTGEAEFSERFIILLSKKDGHQKDMERYNITNNTMIFLGKLVQ